MTDELCVIFDLDGTLVDSEGLCQQGYLELLPELDDTVEGMIGRYRGLKFAPVKADLEHRIGRELPEDFERTYRARVAELLESELTPVPGVVEMLEALPYPCCIASNGPLHKMGVSLAACDLASFFEERLFSAYEVNSWKPDPGLFLHAGRAMGIPPDRCVVVEDSKVGLEAAISAEMIAIRYAPHPDDLSDAPEVISFSEMRELPDLLYEIAAYKRKWSM